MSFTQDAPTENSGVPDLNYNILVAYEPRTSRKSFTIGMGRLIACDCTRMHRNFKTKNPGVPDLNYDILGAYEPRTSRMWFTIDMGRLIACDCTSMRRNMLKPFRLIAARNMVQSRVQTKSKSLHPGVCEA
ncbi:hypothetical protein HDU89_001650 [Geranomyces variabilis]|nr:hypothetical protein HDU89_001650 [Geranomyces variabilis]